MAEEKPDVHSMQTDIRLLQQGQHHIQQSIMGMSGKIDKVADAITTFIQLAEKHNALQDRVKSLEEGYKERSTIANMGRAYMFAATIIVPFVFGALYWIGNQTVDLKERVTKHDTYHQDNR